MRPLLPITLLASIASAPAAAVAGGPSLFEQVKQERRAPKARAAAGLPNRASVVRRAAGKGFVHPRLRGLKLAHERAMVAEVPWVREGGWATVLKLEGPDGPRAVRVFTQSLSEALAEDVRASIATLPERYARLRPRLERARAAGLDALVAVDYLHDALPVDVADRPTVAEYRAGTAPGWTRSKDVDAEIARGMARLRKTGPVPADEVVIERVHGTVQVSRMARVGVVESGWARGASLDEHVERVVDGDPARIRGELYAVARALRATVRQLRKHGIAHGDLQHGNIFVDGGADGVRLGLIDYDGMWTPEVAELGAANGGHPDYQHPRRGDQFDAEIDNFSAAVLYTSLIAIAEDPELFRERQSGRSLLLTDRDLEDPHRAGQTLAELSRRPGQVGKLARRLVHYLEQPASRTPSLDQFIREAADEAP